MSAQSIDALGPNRLRAIARLHTRGLSRDQELRSCELELHLFGDPDLAAASARRPGPMRWGLGVERSAAAGTDLSARVA